jgi:hypothetical protein
MEIVKEYFDVHFDQLKRNIYNYPKKLTASCTQLMIENINPEKVSTIKANAHDGIQGKLCERPKLTGRNKTVEKYQRIVEKDDVEQIMINKYCE